MGRNKELRDERELVRRAKEYDEAAFAEIYERYYNNIFTYIYYRVDDEALAEDLAADVFVRALESIGSFTLREGVPFSAWLFRIANNLVIDQYRLPKESDIIMEDGLVSGAEGPAEIVDKTLTAEQLRGALLHLTEDQRQAIVLRYVDGLKYQEIAHVLGKSEGAIKGLLHRGVASLGRILGVPDS